LKRIFALFALASSCLSAHAQRIAVADFESIVTRNCIYNAEAAKIVAKYAPERAQLRTLKGVELAAFAKKTQARIDADFTALFAQQSVAVAQFEREYARQNMISVLLDSSVRDKNGRPLAVMYVDLSPESSVDATNAILTAYDAKNGCAANGTDSAPHAVSRDDSRKP
jgi:hypothetical protein